MLLAAGCTDGGAGGDQVVTAPSTSPTTAAPTPSPESEAATPSPSPTAAPGPTPDGQVASEVLAATDGPVRFTVALDDPTTPTELADAIVASEEVARDASLSAGERTVAAHRGQRAYRRLGRETAWRDQVLDELPERWRTVAAGNLAARDALNRLLDEGDPPTALPAWEIVAPAPADELLQHYRDAEAEIGADWELLAAINLVETRMGRIRGLSTAGARGPMQFIPDSWDAFGAGGDIEDPRDSIFAAARHLTERPGSPPSERAALFNYNNSVDYVDAVQAYADVLRADPDAYHAYHGWQVYFSTADDEFLLPVGYREEEPVPVEEYLQREAVAVVR